EPRPHAAFQAPLGRGLRFLRPIRARPHPAAPTAAADADRARAQARADLRMHVAQPRLRPLRSADPRAIGRAIHGGARLHRQAVRVAMSIDEEDRWAEVGCSRLPLDKMRPQVGNIRLAPWIVWTIIKWSGISVAFLLAIALGWLVVLVAWPAHAALLDLKIVEKLQVIAEIDVGIQRPTVTA